MTALPEPNGKDSEKRENNMRFLVTLLFVVIATASAAEDAAPKPCSEPAHRQFDFWLGHWVAYSADGKKQGENHLHKVVGDCAIQENWSSGGGAFQGKSFNFYDQRGGRWHQTWVDNQGGHLFLSGGLVGGSMQLSGDGKNREGKDIINRITWTPLDDGRVRQHWQVSADEGESWQDVFDGYYERQEAGQE